MGNSTTQKHTLSMACLAMRCASQRLTAGDGPGVPPAVVPSGWCNLLVSTLVVSLVNVIADREI
jgi:hypothetical protein